MENYAASLEGPALQCYNDKMCLMKNIDPYALPAEIWSKEWKNLPELEFPDIVNYCLFSRSAYTLQELKAYKLMDSYNQFINGWVTDVCSFAIPATEMVVVKGKVLHSQRLSKPPLQPWFLARNNGKVLAAQCNCMAGLAESGTHVCAIMFAVQAAISLEKCRTVTDQLAYWTAPPTSKDVQYVPVRDIDFTSAPTKKNKMDTTVKQWPSQEK